MLILLYSPVVTVKIDKDKQLVILEEEHEVNSHTHTHITTVFAYTIHSFPVEITIEQLSGVNQGLISYRTFPLKI